MEGEIRMVKLDNGLRVLLKRNAHLPLVNIQAMVLGGSLVDDAATAGRSALVADMLDRGTAGHTARQIAEYFDSIGGQMSMSAGRFTVFGSATTLRDDFPGAATLFAECFLHSTFPEDEFAKVQRLALGAIAARADDPQQEISECFCDNLPADSPYHVVEGGKAESVSKLTAGDLREYHAKYFVPNNMIVTVFGDIDPEKALALVKKLFGDLKPEAGFQPLSFDRSNAIAEVDRAPQGDRQGYGHGVVWLSDGEHFRQARLRRDDAVEYGHGGLRVSERMAAPRIARRGAGVLGPGIPGVRARTGLFRHHRPNPARQA